MITRPEVLAPAGDMECLNSALSFGARRSIPRRQNVWYALCIKEF